MDFWPVLRHYWDLGFLSFGGPGVHVVILRKRFVDNLHWLDERTFLDLFSLGNALPGPGSTQLAFSIACVRCGVIPGLLAFLLWSLPGAVGMAALAAGVSRIPETLPGIVSALLTGFNAAAIGLIALAATQLGTAASTDTVSRMLVWLSACFGVCYHAPWMYPTLIAVGGLTTLSWDQRRQIKRWARFWRKWRRAGDQPDASSSQGPPNEGIDLDPTPEPRQSLQVVSVRVALVLLGGFVLFLTIPLSTRAGLANAGQAVPRALDVSVSRAGSAFPLSVHRSS